MGWGTYFKTEVELHKEAFSCNAEVDEAIEECEIFINKMERKLLMFAAANPKDILPNEEHPVEMLQYEIEEILEAIHDELAHLHKLELLSKYLHDNPGVDVRTLNSNYAA